jgi:hypothetical protein
MATNSKKNISGGKLLIAGKPKRTHQGNGRNSKSSHGRKKLRGQGKG